MFDATNFVMPKLTKSQKRSNWLASHGYRELIMNGSKTRMVNGEEFPSIIHILKPLPVGNTEYGFVPCSVEPELISEDGETLRHFIERTHPEWFDNWNEFFDEEYEFKYYKY